MVHVYLDCAETGNCGAPCVDKNKLISAFGAEYTKSLTRKSDAEQEMSLLGATLLLSMLESAGIPHGENTLISRNENGKPYFPALPNICFSISHSNGTVVCALSDGGEVGIDLEYLSLPESSEKAEQRKRIAARWLAPRGIETTDTPESFLCGWTALEAASKYAGGRLSECRAIPAGTLTDRFVKKEEDSIGVITLCRNLDSTVEVSAAAGALGFIPANNNVRDTVTVLGVIFDNITLKNAVSKAQDELTNGGDRVMTVFTPNPLISMQCRRDPDFCRIINSSSLSLADGRGVVDAAKHLGTPLPERVAGIDFGYEIMKIAAEKHAGVFLLGGKHGIAKKAAKRLENELPGLKVCGAYDGYAEAADEAALTSALLMAKPRLLIVCLGSPRQEHWIYEHLPMLREAGVRVAAALGGAVDVWAGEVRRAPKLFIRLRLEWLWRCLTQPRRLRCIPQLIEYRVLTLPRKK